MNYYYFAATLPPLSFEEAPPLTPGQFLSRCREHLTPRDLAAMEAMLDPAHNTSHAFVLSWRDREVQIRNAVVHARASRLRRDPGPYLRPASSTSHGVEKICADALLRHNPWERERALDRYRWSQVEDLAGLESFSIVALLAYAAKLSLLHRWVALDETAGRQRLEAMAQMTPVTAEGAGASKQFQAPQGATQMANA